LVCVAGLTGAAGRTQEGFNCAIEVTPINPSAVRISRSISSSMRFSPACPEAASAQPSILPTPTARARMGDCAVNVSQAVEVLNTEPPLKPSIDPPRLAELTQEMVRDSLDSFVRKDARAALDVCKRDDDVDGLYKQLFRELVTYMAEDAKNITRALHLLLVARNYERIADHATNIGEDVIYYVEGRDIRHSESGSEVGRPN